jgi:hypothetical protein
MPKQRSLGRIHVRGDYEEAFSRKKTLGNHSDSLLQSPFVAVLKPPGVLSYRLSTPLAPTSYTISLPVVTYSDFE